jgi:hypothetical protein
MELKLGERSICSVPGEAFNKGKNKNFEKLAVAYGAMQAEAAAKEEATNDLRDLIRQLQSARGAGCGLVSIDAVEDCIKRGADVNGCVGDIGWSRGISFIGCVFGTIPARPDILRVLREGGAKLDKANGSDLIDIAIGRGNVNGVELLVSEWGVDPNVKTLDGKGMLPLEIVTGAAGSGGGNSIVQGQLIWTLLTYGADPGKMEDRGALLLNKVTDGCLTGKSEDEREAYRKALDLCKERLPPDLVSSTTQSIMRSKMQSAMDGIRGELPSVGIRMLDRLSKIGMGITSEQSQFLRTRLGHMKSNLEKLQSPEEKGRIMTQKQLDADRIMDEAHVLRQEAEEAKAAGDSQSQSKERKAELMRKKAEAAAGSATPEAVEHAWNSRIEKAQADVQLLENILQKMQVSDTLSMT